jgi:formate hydrogenlyase transcriptional activator
MRDVYQFISRVAKMDSTVLISGESGTGKELVARAVHRNSSRANKPCVAINCAALAETLLESELFGHEKGAFTGAVAQRIGRFELASGGSIFIDEVGELPEELQVALLRVLQEGEFERVGGAQTIHTDARVIAATNRDLAAAVEQGRFRRDLFYRLNVFPIEMPPLRSRKQDVPILVEYFAARYAARLGKKLARIDKKTRERLIAYEWPGNVRELANVIERAVILSETDVLRVEERELGAATARTTPSPSGLRHTLESQERDLIESVLAESHGLVSGPRGAAARLGIPPTTLESKIKRFAIDKYRYRSRNIVNSR